MKIVLASDFASLADLAAFQRAKAAGMSDKQAFAVGDNGVGCWGDVTAQEHQPMCALPPEVMIEKWGSVKAAAHKRVRVDLGHKSIICILADRMPHLENITNGCGIDLNPAALKALGLRSPLKIAVRYDWI